MPAYSRILLPWDSQPQEAVGVDESDPAASLFDTLFNFAPACGLRNSLESGGTAVSGVQGFSANAGGVGLNATGSSGYVNAGLIDDYTSGSFFIFVVVTLRSISNSPVIVSKGLFGGTGYYLQVLSTGAIEFRAQSSVNSAPAGTVVAGGTYKILVAGTVGAPFKIYVDGVEKTTTSSNQTPTSSVRSLELMAYNTGGSNYLDGVLYLYGSGNRKLPQSSISCLNNPWQLFTPRSIWVPVAAGGGGTSISGALGTATASGLSGTVNANRTIAGALGTATATGFQGTVSNSTDTTITGALGVATASGFKGTVGANRGIAGALGTAIASGFTGAVANDNSTTIAGALGTATATGFTGAITWSRYIAGLLGVAQASGFAGGVQNGAAPVIATGGGIYPTPRRKTKQEIDEDRKRLGILPDEPEIQTGIVETPKRAKITLDRLIGKPAADTHRADMERASAAHKLRKRRQDDDLLMMM